MFDGATLATVISPNIKPDGFFADATLVEYVSVVLPFFFQLLRPDTVCCFGISQITRSQHYRWSDHVKSTKTKIFQVCYPKRVLKYANVYVGYLEKAT
jgi:hypothetical protein